MALRTRLPPRGLLALAVAFAPACDAQQPDRTEAIQAMVDSLLPRLERFSGLEQRAPFAFALRTREDLLAYVERQMEEELPPEELAGMETAYRDFGLLPDTLDLRGLLLALYMEQVVGYYDPETDTLYLLEDVPPSGLRDVLAHELVHALQDQHEDLEALVDRSRGNDRQTAAQAAVEGHATLVMLALALADRAGGEVPPDLLAGLVQAVAEGGQAEAARFPALAAAPRIVRETLLFPYLDGLRFAHALWLWEDGYPAPLGERIPQSTEQIMEPRARFLQERDPPTTLALAASPEAAPAATAAAPAWRLLYESTLGQLEIGILLTEHLGAGADRLAAGWDGDLFRLLEDSERARAIVWYSVWDDAPAADAFADAYRRVLAARPGRSGSVDRLELDGRPLVRVVELDAPGRPERVPVPEVTGLTEERR